MESLARPLPGLTRAGLIGALLALAAGAWALTACRMAGMDAGPGSDLGPVGWFAFSWLVMMAAMMLPSLVPAALAVLAIWMAVAPGDLPGLTLPGSMGGM